MVVGLPVVPFWIPGQVTCHSYHRKSATTTSLHHISCRNYWRLQPQPPRVFVQELLQAYNAETSKVYITMTTIMTTTTRTRTRTTNTHQGNMPCCHPQKDVGYNYTSPLNKLCPYHYEIMIPTCIISGLFVPQLVQINNKTNITAPYFRSYVSGNYWWQVDPIRKRASNAESGHIMTFLCFRWGVCWRRGHLLSEAKERLEVYCEEMDEKGRCRRTAWGKVDKTEMFLFQWKYCHRLHCIKAVKTTISAAIIDESFIKMIFRSVNESHTFRTLCIGHGGFV